VRAGNEHPFPLVRPKIEITECDEPLGPIDFPELRWWCAIPRLGHRTMRAGYNALTLEIEWVDDMIATMPARVHGVECVEIEVKEWRPGGSWTTPLVFYAREEADAESRWLAVAVIDDGEKKIVTFRDEEFESQWGASDAPFRTLFDDGRYERLADGRYRITSGKGLGAGTYDVTIGDRTFRCLRVLEPDLDVPEGGELVEAYVTPEGRTVLSRRYDGRFFRGVDLLEKYPNNLMITIGEWLYVHSDCWGRPHGIITDTALGIDLASVEPGWKEKDAI
jgi:hypothetical protein